VWKASIQPWNCSCCSSSGGTHMKVVDHQILQMSFMNSGTCYVYATRSEGGREMLCGRERGRRGGDTRGGETGTARGETQTQSQRTWLPVGGAASSCCMSGSSTGNEAATMSFSGPRSSCVWCVGRVVCVFSEAVHVSVVMVMV
jgi:hypothetical protein